MDTRYDNPARSRGSARAGGGAWWLMRHDVSDVAGNSKYVHVETLRPFHGRWTREQGTRAFRHCRTRAAVTRRRSPLRPCLHSSSRCSPAWNVEWLIRTWAALTQTTAEPRLSRARTRPSKSRPHASCSCHAIVQKGALLEPSYILRGAVPIREAPALICVCS